MHEATPYLVVFLNIVVGFAVAVFWFLFNRFIARIDKMDSRVASVESSLISLNEHSEGRRREQERIDRELQDVRLYRAKIEERLHGLSNFLVTIYDAIRELKTQTDARYKL